MFVRRKSDEKMLWQTLGRQWLRKSSSQIATLAIQKSGTEAKSCKCRGGL